MAREQRYLLHVRHLRVWREISHLHVFGHALPKGCHKRNSFAKWNVLQAATQCFRKMESLEWRSKQSAQTANRLRLRFVPPKAREGGYSNGRYVRLSGEGAWWLRLVKRSR